MEITVNVSGELDLDEVIDRRQIQIAEDEYDEEPVTLRDVVVSRMVRKAAKESHWRPLVERVRELRDEQIRELLAPEITAAIQAPIQRTNTYGEPTGTATTLRELIVAQAQAVLAAKQSRDGYGGKTLLQEVIQKEVAAALQKELVAEVKAARETVVAAVKTHASTMIADAVRAGLATRS